MADQLKVKFQLTESIIQTFIPNGLPNPSKKFLERIIDDDKLSLIKNNLILRERISYLNENEPIEIALIKTDKNIKIKTKDKIMQKIGKEYINQYLNIDASYIVFRYYVHELCAVDKVIWNVEIINNAKYNFEHKMYVILIRELNLFAFLFYHISKF